MALTVGQGSGSLVVAVPALLFGGAISGLYPLCVAQTFDRLDRRYYVAASGRLLMVYSIGAATGPLTASAVMSAFGPGSFFALESLAAAAFAIVILVCARTGGAPVAEDREPFVPLPDGAPVTTRLDPRTDPEGSVDMPRPARAPVGGSG